MRNPELGSELLNPNAEPGYAAELTPQTIRQPGEEELGMLKNFVKGMEHREYPGWLVTNPSHQQLYEAVIGDNDRWQVEFTSTGAWAEVNPDGERGRNPGLTFFVKDKDDNSGIYWEDSEKFQEFPREKFTALVDDSLQRLSGRQVFETARRLVADDRFSHPIMTYTDSPSGAVFSKNMLIDGKDLSDVSVFANKPPITVIALPHDSDKVNPDEFGIRHLLPADKQDAERVPLIISDPASRTILIRGFAYHGPMKKGPYTLMNLFLPQEGVFPMHASANEGPDGDVAVYAGLSGTGKSTIGSLFEDRRVIGDDEIAISSDTTSNIENSYCYPIMKGIRAETEPALHEAATTPKPPEENTVVFQNVVVGENGEIDVDDTRYTQNTRVSAPMLNAKPSLIGSLPKNFFFIAKISNGVWPPLAKLNKEQAELAFLMGATSKTAAEEGAMPGATFSRFFGAPFMSAHPKVYLDMFRQVLEETNANVWMVNTGFYGGVENQGGERFPIPVTKAVVGAALKLGENALQNQVAFRPDPRFGFMVPLGIPGSPEASALLNPKYTWEDKNKFDETADHFAQQFHEFFAASRYDQDADLSRYKAHLPKVLGSLIVNS